MTTSGKHTLLQNDQPVSSQPLSHNTDIQMFSRSSHGWTRTYAISSEILPSSGIKLSDKHQPGPFYYATKMTEFDYIDTGRCSRFFNKVEIKLMRTWKEGKLPTLPWSEWLITYTNLVEKTPSSLPSQHWRPVPWEPFGHHQISGMGRCSSTF